MAKTVRTGLLITGDASGAVQATQLTRDELDKLNAKQQETGRASQTLRERMDGVSTSLRSVAKFAATAGAAVGAVAAGALVQLTRSGLESADALAKTSDKLNIATGELASMRIAAERTAGMANGAFDTALQRMVRRVQDAAEGTGEAQGAIDDLGLSAQALAQLSPDQQFRRIADAMSGVDEQGKRVSLAFRLFDTEGVDLVNTLRVGSAGLDQFAAKADIAGVTLDRVAASQIEAANDAMSDLSMLTEGLGMQLADRFSPLLQEAAEQLFGVAEEAGGMGEVADRVFKAVITGVGFVADAIHGLRVVIKGIEIVFREFGAQILDEVAMIARGWTELANLIPGIQVDPETNFLVQTARVARDGVREAREELEALANTEMPSLRLQDFVADLDARSQREAEAQAMAREAEAQESRLRALTSAAADLVAETQKYELKSAEAADSAKADQDQIQKALAETEGRAASLGETQLQVANDVTRAWEEAMNRIDSTFSSAWQGAFNSFSDFASSLKQGFSQLLGELAHFSISRPILVNMGILGGGAGGSMAAAASGGAGGGGVLGGLGSLAGIGGMLKGGLAGISGSLTQGVVGASNLLTNLGAGGLATQLQLSAANLSTMPGGLAGGVGISALSGIAGSMLSDALGLSGKHSGTLGTIGGIAGTLFGGPIGGGIGSFLGSAVGGLIGKGPQVARVGVDTGGIQTRGALAGTGFDAASGLRIQAVAMRAGEEGEQAARSLAQRFGQIDEVLTTALRGAGVDVDLTGVRLGGTQRSGQGFIGSDIKGGINQSAIDGAADEFVREWLDAVNDELPQRVRGLMRTGLGATAEEMVTALEQALALDMLIDLDVVNETEKALEALGREQGTLLDQYDRQVENVLELAGEFDRSADSLQTLTDALRAQKEVAAELALTYQLLTEDVDAMFKTTMQSIRESLMGDEELFAFRRQEIRRLTSELGSAEDPGEIARITEAIDRLTQAAFGQLDEGQQQELGAEFIGFLENANRIAQRQLEAGLQQLQSREAGVGRAVDLELSVQAANTQLAASQQFSEAVAAFQQAVSSGRFGFSFPVNIGVPFGLGEVNR